MMFGVNIHRFTTFTPSQHNDITTARKEHALDLRIRRMAQIMVTKESNDLQKPPVCRLHQASWQEWLKLIIGLCCLGVFLYQDYDRITFYLGVPVTVTVSIAQEEYMSFPAVTVCFTDFGPLTNLLLTPHEKKNLLSCEDETNKTGQQVMNTSNISFWKGRTDINATWITAKLEPNLPVKLQKVQVLSLGVCTTFYADALVKFQGNRQMLIFELKSTKFHCGPYYPRMFAAHLPGNEANHKDFVGANLGSRGSEFGMSITKYKFLNRQKIPCSNIHTYWECMDRCHTKMWPKLLTCRTHFLSPELTEIPLCNSRRKFQSSLVESFYKVGPLDPVKTCKCIQPCERTIFKMNYRPQPDNEPIQKLSLFFEDNFVTRFEEHYAYGFIALLCDVGGIMGLYLGWSLLSICSLLQILYPHMNDSLAELQKSWVNDPIYLKVRKQYKQLKEGNVKIFMKLLQHGTNIPGSSSVHGSFKYIRYLLLLVCMIGCIYITYDRVAVYLRIPVVVIVEIKPQTELIFPNFTYCKDTNDTIKYKQQIAASRNLSSFCEVEFLEILDIPGMSISKLWDISYSDDAVTENTDFTNRRIQLLGESCVDVNLGKRVHKGRNFFDTITMLPQCYDSLKIYITPPGSDFDFSHYYVVTNRIFYPRFQLKIQEYHVSPLLTNCLSDQDAKRCKTNCINKSMLENLRCRFPLMPEEYKSLPLCESFKTAKEARDTYINILTSTDFTNDCKCQRQCHRSMFECDIFVIPGKTWSYPNVMTRVGYVEPERQIFTEIPSYTTTKLFCDIGGILGLLLGFSFLSFMDIIIQSASVWINALFRFN